MLTRIVSAAVAIVIAVGVLMMHNTIVLPIVVSLLIALMLFELFKANSCLKYYSASIPAILCGMLKPMIYATAFEKYGFGLDLLAVFLVMLTFIIKHKELNFEKIAYILASMILVPTAMLTALKIEALDDNHGVVFLILGLCGAWIADSGAYFVGTFLGKHKLCPEISPKKTVEGFVGGIIVTAIVFVAFNLVYANFISVEKIEVNYVLMAITGMVCAVIGTIGDLSASMIKRQTGIKDFGNIMPGHGGAMDRFDSVLFVMPTFYLMLSIMDIYK